MFTSVDTLLITARRRLDQLEPADGVDPQVYSRLRLRLDDAAFNPPYAPPISALVLGWERTWDPKPIAATAGQLSDDSPGKAQWASQRYLWLIPELPLALLAVVWVLFELDAELWIKFVAVPFAAVILPIVWTIAGILLLGVFVGLPGAVAFRILFTGETSNGTQEAGALLRFVTVAGPVSFAAWMISYGFKDAFASVLVGGLTLGCVAGGYFASRELAMHSRRREMLRDLIRRADDLLMGAGGTDPKNEANGRGSERHEPEGAPPKPEAVAMARLAGYVGEAGGQDSEKTFRVCGELRSFLRTTFGLAEDQFHRSLIAGTALTELGPLVEVLKPYCLRALAAQDLVMQIAWRIASAAGEPSLAQRQILEEVNRQLCGSRYDVAEMIGDSPIDLTDFDDPAFAAEPPPDMPDRPEPNGLSTNMAAVARLLGYIAKADGRVSPSEIEAAESQLILKFGTDLWTGDPVPREAFVKAFGEGKRLGDLRLTLATLHAACGEDDTLRQAVAVAAFHVAAADGHVGDQEAAVLRDLEQALYGGRGIFTEMAKETNAGSPYAVLGLAPPCTRDEARKAYRKKLAEYHPDTLRHQKIPKEMRAFAEQRYRTVQEAWEQIERDLG